jgi:signal transduction histidine kinase/ActR/RegA family two-component response regulator
LINRTLRDRRIYGWHITWIGLVICLLWAGIGLNLRHEYDHAEQEALHDTANLAHAFEENITRTIEGVDQALLFMRAARQYGTAGLGLGHWADTRPLLGDLHVQMGISDRNGNVIWSNLTSEPTRVNIADREHFQAPKNSSEDKLFISKPVVGRISGTRTIQFSRKLLAADGSFNGVAVVSLDPDYLSRFYRSISIGDGSILLTRTDGLILARSPNSNTVPEWLPHYATLRVLHATENGSFRGESSIDRVERIFSSRRLRNYPLTVTVGLATKDVFAPFIRSARIYVSAGAALSIAIIVVGFVMIRQRNALLASRQALAVTLEHMSQGIVMIDEDRNVRIFNQRALDLLGLPRALLDPRRTGGQIVNSHLKHGEFGNQEIWNPNLSRPREAFCPNGDYIHEGVHSNGLVLEVRTQHIPDGGIVRTYTDITARKQSEADLAAAQARATHAERMQVLGRLAGGIAHDFNNILQAVQGSATLISKRVDDPSSIRRFAQMISDVTERGASITRRLLAFARRGELRAEPVDAAALLSGLCEILSHTLGGSVTVETRVSGELPPLLADRGQLETVVVNLAMNARDAMPGGGTLTLSATAEAAPEPGTCTVDLPGGRYVRLSIADTGTGMDEPTLVRAMEPFFSTKPPGQGTGLGLSMAKGFVEQSGGALSIDSVPGRGTTVSLWLPATTRAETITPPPPKPLFHEESGTRILLVDDEAMIRETLAACLEDRGFEVLTADGGAEALDILASRASIDVLVTDLSMPGVDGLAVIEKARHHRPDLPAILLTGYAGHGAQLAVGASISGRFTLVRKPVSEAQLIDRIEALLAVGVSE